MCLYPRKLKNRRYQITKKNGGSPPLMSDERMDKITVPCGKCSVCVKKKKKEWIMRINEENKDSGVPHIVTMTYSDERLKELREMVIRDAKGVIPEENVLLNEMVKKSVKLWRKWYHKYKGKSPKRWLISERGEKSGRIHLHGFIWNVDEEELRDSWQRFNGHMHFGKYMGTKTIVYATKYFNKVDMVNKDYKGIMLVSPGIGKGYLKREKGKHEFKGEDTRIKYRFENGAEGVLPRYYRDKLWNDDERIKLWEIALNDEKMENKIWLNGKEYDETKDDITEIYERERRKDRRLGYKVNRSRKEQRFRNEIKKTKKFE